MPGAVQADSDGDGGSFVPASPFAPGETVTVSTSLNLEGSGNGTYQFQVATPAGTIPFAHRPAAPRVKGDVWCVPLAPGPGAGGGAAITKRDPGGDRRHLHRAADRPDPAGTRDRRARTARLIWFNPVPKDQAVTDFRTQSYHGQAVLTWWQGNEAAGVGSGQDVILSSSYQVVKVVSAGNGLTADLHEFQLTPRGTALITAEYPVYVERLLGRRRDASRSCSTRSCRRSTSPTGLVLFQWDSLDHVPLTATYIHPPGKAHVANGIGNPFDYFHVNSVEADHDGNLLISSRNTWAVYKVNHHTGAIIWTLGGKHSSFKLGRGASFAFQHDVRVRAYGDQFLTMFDDGAGPPYVHSQSRALKLELNLKHMTADVADQHEHSPPLLASFEGNDEQLPDQDDFVGWGQAAVLQRVQPAGQARVRRSVRRRQPHLPRLPPPVERNAVDAPVGRDLRTKGRKMTVYVSWNGATNVTGWRVFAGNTPTKLPAVATAAKRGFETAIKAPARKYVAVQALGAKGHGLSRTSVQPVH